MIDTQICCSACIGFCYVTVYLIIIYCMMSGLERIGILDGLVFIYWLLIRPCAIVSCYIQLTQNVFVGLCVWQFLWMMDSILLDSHFDFFDKFLILYAQNDKV